MKNYVKIGKLESVSLTDLWKHEADDFTPWLAEPENLEILSEQLGIRLILKTVEHRVGRYYADMVCEDGASGEIILIENQIKPTDHRHLGQICTYAAGLKASVIIWISERINAEHREAIDWLNSISNDETSFYAVNVKAWKIGNSEYAPSFEIVAQPPLLSRAALRDVKNSSNDELSESQKQYVEYWTGFIEKVSDVLPSVRNRTPYRGCWQTVSSMTVEKGLYIEFNCYASGTNVRSEAYIGGVSAKILFRALENHKDQINAEFGAELSWEYNHGKQDCRIAKYLVGETVDHGPQAKKQYVWMAKSMALLLPIIKKYAQEVDMETASESFEAEDLTDEEGVLI